MTDTTTEIDPKPTKKLQKSSGYISLLAVSMIIAALIGGVYGFIFGKKSLEGVNSVPLGSKNLKLQPTTKPQTNPRSALPQLNIIDTIYLT
jgi:hypothetical protein